jgi:putative ABC transport system permease protein
MDSLLYDIRSAVRRLPKTPWFTLAVVATLALAIGANTLIFSIVDGVLLKPLPYGNASRLVGVVSATPHGTDGVSLPDLIDWRQQSHKIDAYASYGLSPATMTGRGIPERVNAAVVSGNWFSLLGVAPGAGQFFNPSDDRPEAGHAIVLSDALWRTRFAANPSLVGQTLVLDGEAFNIIGIAPPRFTYPGTPDVWLPEILTEAEHAPGLRHQRFRRVIARVATGATLDAAREEFETVTDRLRQQYPQEEGDVHYVLEPLSATIAGGVRPVLLVLFGAVGCVLLIACANVTNLLLVRATGRSTEIALRVAIGAGRGRVIQELLVESFVLALAGAALGVILAVVGMQMVVGAQVGGLPRLDEVGFNGRTLTFALTIALVTGALFGIVPAMQASRVDIGESLKSATRGSSGHRRSGRVRGGLVVAETALTVVLLVGAGLLTRSLIHLLDVDPGFRPTQVVAFDVSFYSPQYANWARARAFVHAVKDRLQAIPGSQRVAYGFGVPFAGYPDAPVNFEIQGRPVVRGEQPAAIIEPISAGYFATLGVPIKEGREFTDDDRSHGRRVLVINETAARRFFPQGGAVGHHLTIDVVADSTGKGDSVQLGGDIVGIVGDTKFAELTAPAPAEIFQPHEQVSRTFVSFIVRTTADPASVLAASARAVGAIDGNVPIFHGRALTADVAASLARPRLYTMVVATFAGVSLMLAVIGIYGVLAYVVRERRRELGIRLALGARGQQLVGLVVAHGLRLVGVGLAIGCVIALIGGRVLTSLLFGVHPNDVVTYATVCGVLLFVAALASWAPARGAAAIDPIIAMRGE